MFIAPLYVYNPVNAYDLLNPCNLHVCVYEIGIAKSKNIPYLTMTSLNKYSQEILHEVVFLMDQETIELQSTGLYVVSRHH